jgi:hemolysin III
MSGRRHPEYTLAEDLANSITHGIAAGLSIAGLTLLVVLAAIKGDPWRIVAFSIYGTTLVALYVTSTLYHGIRTPAARRVLRRLDHVAIYLLIAGTYTPFTLVVMRGGWGWTLFGVTWALAALGVGIKAAFTGRFEAFSIGLYVALGWVGVVAIKPVIETLPLVGIAGMVVGGLFYTFGLAFYAWNRLPFNHAIWHLFVVAGSVIHFVMIVLFVLP